MENAVWVYLNEDFCIADFLAWVDEHNVKLVLLHLDGTTYVEGPLVEPMVDRFVDACLAQNLQVHGMFNALTSVPKHWINQQHKDLFCVDYHGISILDEPISGRRYFMDPNRAAVVELLKGISGNILRSYPGLSGLQLDFIRYYHWESSFTIDAREMGHNLTFLKLGNPLRLSIGDKSVSYYLKEAAMLYHDPPLGDKFTFYHKFSYCFCEHCLADFTRNYQVAIPSQLEQTMEKAAWILNYVPDKWHEFRASTLQSVVKEIHQVVKGIHCEKQLSVTIWYNSPYGNELVGKDGLPASEYTGFGQKWWSWVDSGLIDFVCPMNYWLSPSSFGQMIKEQVSRLSKAVPLYSGLLRSGEYPIDEVTLKEYILQARSAPARGICFFHYGTWKDMKADH